MAYTRKYKKNYYKKKTGRYTNKGRVVATTKSAQYTANKALKMVKKVMKKIEYKHEEYVRGFDAPQKIDSLGNIFNITSNIDRGSNIHQRIGDKITLARLSGRMRFQLSKLTGSNPDGYLPTRTYRIVVFRGIRENGTLYYPSISQSAEMGILNDLHGEENMLPIACRKDDTNIRRTKFLFDKTYTLGGGKDTQRIHNFNFKTSWTTQYTHDSGEDLIADGGLYIMVISDTDGVGTGNNENAIFIDMNMRMSFTDL